MQDTGKTNRMIGPLVVASIAIVGLFTVKWSPYYARALAAAANHAIGKSILMGTQAHAPDPSWGAAFDYALAYGKAIWQAMLLGLLLGSAIQALLPKRWISRALGGTGFGTVLAAGMMALPGMMCTCCAAPVVLGLRRENASPGAATAFWLGNSVLNPATLVFIGFVLGWQWTGLRLALGLVMVFGLGHLVNRFCAESEGTARPALSPAETGPANPFLRWLSILAGMAIRLIPEYVVIVLLLGATRAWLFPAIGPQIGNELGWVAAFAVAGMVFVIPTAGEVPIIQAMLALGMGVGPAGALLMTMPPISLPSLAMLSRALSLRAITVVMSGVVALGVAGGCLAIVLGF
jgi:uncharacterized membrane protein YraQ (UPF0718 family)